jgi:small-conductance mechanosensitive channel
MTRSVLDRLEGWLLRRGYVHPEVRELVRNQVLLTALVLAASALAFPFWNGAWALAVGTCLITFNFCSLARFGQRITGYANRREAVAAVLIRFYLRLTVTGLVLFICIAWLGAKPLPLLAGISTVVGNFVVWGALRQGGSKAHQTFTGKEA